MSRITDYNSVRGYRVEDLEDEVRQAIKEGWQPFGTPYVFADKRFQALVKYEDENTPTPGSQEQYDRQAEIEKTVARMKKDMTTDDTKDDKIMEEVYRLAAVEVDSKSRGKA
jgi:hypothetical protein